MESGKERIKQEEGVVHGMDYEWIDLHALLTAITVGTNVDCS